MQRPTVEGEMSNTSAALLGPQQLPTVTRLLQPSLGGRAFEAESFAHLLAAKTIKHTLNP